MPLDAEVDLGPGATVLDGDAAPQKSGGGTAPPNFGPCIVAKQLHRSRCHLVRGKASTQATLCYRGPSSP